jgi:hypothetical protein
VAGQSQPLITADLERRPPDLVDARARLAALSHALAAPLDTPDAIHATDELRAILAMPRYHTSSQVPWYIAARDWMAARVKDVLSFLSSLLRPSGSALDLLRAAIFVAAVAIVVGLVVSAYRRGRLPDFVPRARRPATEKPHDYFAEADARAAEGDYAAAVRALVAAVTVALGGSESWTKSPLTVRELFRMAGQLDSLRPLLLPFERAVYGHRVPDRDTYLAANSAAAAYRSGVVTEMAA